MSDYVGRQISRSSKHVKLISLEGVVSHVLRSVAENHHWSPEKKMMIAIESHRKAIPLMNLLITIINEKVCAQSRFGISRTFSRALIKKYFKVFHVSLSQGL